MEEKYKALGLAIGLIACLISLWYSNPFLSIALLIFLILKGIELSQNDPKSNKDKISLVLIIVVIIPLFSSLIIKLPTNQQNGCFHSGPDTPSAELFYLLGVEGFQDGKSQRIDRYYGLPAGDRFIYNYRDVEQTQFIYNFKLESTLFIDNITIDVSTRDKIHVGEITKHTSFILPITSLSSVLIQGFPTNISRVEGVITFNFPTNSPHQIILFNFTVNLNYTYYMMEQQIEDAAEQEVEFIVPDWYADFVTSTFPRYPYYQPSVDNWLDLETSPTGEYESWGLTSPDTGISIFSITNHPYPHLVIIASVFIVMYLIIWLLSLLIGGFHTLTKILFLFGMVGGIVLIIQVMVWEQDPMYIALYDVFSTFSWLPSWPIILVELQIIGMLIQVSYWGMTIGLALLICFAMLKMSAMMSGEIKL